jgi:hypothetical protein
VVLIFYFADCILASKTTLFTLFRYFENVQVKSLTSFFLCTSAKSHIQSTTQNTPVCVVVHLLAAFFEDSRLGIDQMAFPAEVLAPDGWSWPNAGTQNVL